MITKTIIASTLAGLAAAAPAKVARDASAPAFTLKVVAPNYPSLDGQAVQENSYSFWVSGRATNATNSDGTVFRGPTAFTASMNGQRLGLDIGSPTGFQTVYVEGPAGVIKTNPDHGETFPQDAIFSPFEYTAPTASGIPGSLQFNNTDFAACAYGPSEPDTYQLTIQTDVTFGGSINCLPIALEADTYTGPKPDQYL